MALSSDDKKYLKQLIEQTISKELDSKSNSNSNSEKSSKSNKPSKLELYRKRKQNAETLAERIELEKWILANKLNRLPKPVKAAGSAAKGLTVGSYNLTKELAQNTADSKLGKSAIASIMLSNPITALLYQNQDLLQGTSKILGKGIGGLAKGVGKATFGIASYLYGKGKNKYKEPKSLRKLLPENNDNKISNVLGGKNYITTEKLTSKSSKNYIIAKQALFIGGKNTIIMGGMSNGFTKSLLPLGAIAGSAKMLGNTKSDQSILPAGTQTLLPNNLKLPSNIRNVTNKNEIAMVKGIKDLASSAKLTAKLVADVAKKVILIPLLILGGAALIVQAIKGLIPKLPIKNNADKHYKKANELSSISGFSRNNDMNDLLSKHNNLLTGINKESNVVKSDLKSEGLDTWWKPNTNVFTKLFNTGKMTPVLAPWDGIVNKVEVSKSGETHKFRIGVSKSNSTAEVIFDGIIEPMVVPKQKIVRKQLLGMADESFKVIGNSVGLDQLKDYTKFINDEKANNYSDTINLLQNESDKQAQQRIKYYTDLVNKEYKTADKYAGVVESVGLNTDRGQIDNNVLTDYINNNKTIPVNVHSTDINKNTIEAINNANKATPNKENKIIIESPKPKGNVTNSISMSSPTIIKNGIPDTDLQIAYADPYGIKYS